MATPAKRRRWLVGLLLATGLSMGCNPLTAMYFLLPMQDPGIQPECKLEAPERGKEPRVAILAYSGLESRPEFLRADHELAVMLVSRFQKAGHDKKQKLSLVSISRIEKFKDEHPGWHTMGAREIGKHFNADYVIDLDIQSLGLYEPGSRNTLFRGQGNISVNVFDTHKSSDDPIFEREFRCEYPRSRGPVPVDGGDFTPAQFRQKFMQRMATEISWLFLPRTLQDEVTCD